MRAVMCGKCFRWTAMEANPNVALWFLCWECLGSTLPVRKEYAFATKTRVGAPHPFGSFVTGSMSQSQR